MPAIERTRRLYDASFLIVVPANKIRPASLIAVSQTNAAMDVPTYYTLKIVDKYMVYEITSASLYSSGDIQIHGVVLKL